MNTIEMAGRDCGYATQQIKMLNSKRPKVPTLGFTEGREKTKEKDMTDVIVDSKEKISAEIYCEKISRNLIDTDAKERGPIVIKTVKIPKSRSRKSRWLKLEMINKMRSWQPTRLKSKIDYYEFNIYLTLICHQRYFLIFSISC